MKKASPRGARVCVCACVCAFAHGCACVHVCVISEIKHSFQSFCYLTNYACLTYMLNHKNLCHVGLFFCFYMRR